MKFDLNEFAYSNKEVEADMDNKSVELSCTQIEQIKEFYKSRPLELFTFEILYRTDIKIDDIGRLKYEIFDEENCEFKFSKKKKFKIPEDMKSLVLKLKDNSFFNEGKVYSELILKMKVELKEADIVENFKSSDIAITKKKRSHIKCPECGNAFEAKVANWSAYKPTVDSDYWIICKECGDQYNE